MSVDRFRAHLDASANVARQVAIKADKIHVLLGIHDGKRFGRKVKGGAGRKKETEEESKGSVRLWKRVVVDVKPGCSVAGAALRAALGIVEALSAKTQVGLSAARMSSRDRDFCPGHCIRADDALWGAG